MQRRAVAVSVALFLLVSVASYSLIATAEAPTISFENPEHELSEEDTFELDGVTYTVTALSAEEDEDGVIEYSGTIEWTDPESEQSETWDNESTIEYLDGEWIVLVDSEEEPTSFTLEEAIDRQAILEDDPDARNETVENEDGTESVVITDEDGSETLVPADEYFPAPQTEQYAEGDSFEYANNTVTVETVEPTSVTVVWTGEETFSEDFEQEDEITLGDQEFLTFFTSSDTVILTQDFESYEAQLGEMNTYQDRVSGFWYIIITSMTIALLLVMVAFLPSRY